MINRTSAFACFMAYLALAFAPNAIAAGALPLEATQAAAAQPGAPPPASNPLLTAKTVAVTGVAGAQTTNRDIWNPNGSRASLKVEEAMREWGRYK
ncbi:MAG: hypothetical protein EHM24_29250, partial [Acidobacteria bacterium]